MPVPLLGVVVKFATRLYEVAQEAPRRPLGEAQAMRGDPRGLAVKAHHAHEVRPHLNREHAERGVEWKGRG